MDINSLLYLPEDELCIKIDYFKKYYKKANDYIREISKNKKIKRSPDIALPIEKQIKIGCKSLGLYHAVKPLQLNQNQLIIKNFKMLYYYRNRLEGYGIKKEILL